MAEVVGRRCLELQLKASELTALYSHARSISTARVHFDLIKLFSRPHLVSGPDRKGSRGHADLRNVKY